MYQLKSDGSWSTDTPLILYIPNVAWFITSLLCKSSYQCYVKFIPYVRMAAASSGSEDKVSKHKGQKSMHEPLASQPFNSWRFTSAVALIKGRDFVTLFLYLNQVLVALLLPVKVGLVQWSRAATSERNENDIRQADDTQNLEGQISTFFGLFGLLVYTSLLCSSVCIACRCSARRTGLKWSPYSLASQAALLQGSDILARFADLDTAGPRALTNGLARWPKQGCIVRLGYWRKQLSQELVHGVRFLHHDSKVARQRSLNGAQMPPEDSTSPEAIISPPPANTFPGLCSEMQDAAVNNAVDTRASGPPSPKDQADAIHERYSPPFTRDEERCKVPPIECLWNIWLSDAYVVLLSVLTVAGLVAMGVMVKRGIDTELVYYPKLSSRFGGLAGDMEVNFLLSFLPSMVIDAFFNNIDNVDIYNRTMAPIHNMTKALSDEERARLGLARGTKGATGKRSMLLDYLSPNAVFCIAKAIKAGDYKIAYGTFLATLGRSVFILALPVFLPYWDSTGDSGAAYYIIVLPEKFYAAFALSIGLLVSIWVLRPTGVVRTCTQPHTLMDFASLVHQSPLLLCPDFSVQERADTEAHLAAQVTLAGRVYRFGEYHGIDRKTNLGIAGANTPQTWYHDRNAIACMRQTTSFVRTALKDGLYGGVPDEVDRVARSLPTGQPTMRRVQTSEYEGWRQLASKVQRRCGLSRAGMASSAGTLLPLYNGGRSSAFQAKNEAGRAQTIARR